MNPAVQSGTLSAEELRQRLHLVDPTVVLVPPRILRRVIKSDRGLGGFGLRVPHRRSHIIPRERLLEIVTIGELHCQSAEDLPERVILLPLPNPGDQTRLESGQLLLRYWRLLFHAGLHVALDHRSLTPEQIERRIAGLGAIAFAEARSVLVQEHYLLEDCTSAEVLEELTVVFLELRHFDPHHLARSFPAMEDLEAVERLLAEGIDVAAVLARTRPDGADEPDSAMREELPLPVFEDSTTGDAASPPLLCDRAETAARRGNQIRSIVLRLQAAHRAPSTQAGSLQGPARLEMERFVQRLQVALGLPASDASEWITCLWAVAQTAAHGVWNAEMRFLSDLQKTCLTNERALFSVNLVDWFVSFFRRPLQRPMTDLPLVLTLQHLQRAQGRLPILRLPREERTRLADLLGTALTLSEERLRQHLRPRLCQALDRVGLDPANAAEVLARDKLVEEMLDDIVRHGYLSLGDLRDALASNRLKLPDIKSPLELITGDPLLRVNHALANDIDGVCRRGEVYLRGLQRLSSIFFGNPLGRLLTLYLILPLLGSLFVLKGIEGLADEVHKFILKPLLLASEEELSDFSEFGEDLASGEEAFSAEVEALGAHKVSVLPVFNVYSFFGLAFFLGLLLHVPVFRRGVVLSLWYFWVAVRAVLHDLPTGFFRIPLVRTILRSRPYLLFYQFVGKPLFLSWLVYLLLILLRIHREYRLEICAGLFVLLSAILNTRLGLLLEERTTDWLVRTWQLVSDDLLPGLFRWFIWMSRRLKERVEKIRYTVEEWLLFRQGQSRLSFWFKLGLGLPWSIISYVSRFVIVVLLEPQVNPIKHFPVVTVSHKLMLLIAPPVASALSENLGWSAERTLGMVVLVFSLIPGLFGFLAWELKENWKLYRANQSPILAAEMVGSHGERIINYIRPGFHSGTLPKLFARLRRSRGAVERRQEEGLHHVEEELYRFVDRCLLAPIEKSRGWGETPPLEIGHIHLATNCIRIELNSPLLAVEPCLLELVQVEGRLLAGLRGPGWVTALTPTARDVLRDVLAGFYCRAGVDRVIEPAGLEPFPFREHPVTWQAWVERWRLDELGQPEIPPLVPGVRLLPVTT